MFAVPAVIALLRIPDIVVVSVNVFAAVRIDFRRAHSTNVDNTAITTKTGSAMFAEPDCLWTCWFGARLLRATRAVCLVGAALEFDFRRAYSTT